MAQIESASATLSQEEEQHACCSKSKVQEHRDAELEAHQHHEQHMHSGHHGTGRQAIGLSRTAFMGTLHCLTGCTIGEVLGK